MYTILENTSVIYSVRYDHLAEVLTKILDERPTNAVDIIEDFSYKEKKTKFISDVDTIQVINQNIIFKYQIIIITLQLYYVLI